MQNDVAIRIQQVIHSNWGKGGEKTQPEKITQIIDLITL